jgi:hypothetical protein
MFALIPEGASVVILIEFYNNPTGKVLVGVVDSQSLKSLCGGCLPKSSIIFSNDINQSVDKCTFANSTQ